MAPVLKAFLAFYHFKNLIAAVLSFKKSPFLADNKACVQSWQPRKKTPSSARRFGNGAETGHRLSPCLSLVISI